MRSILPQIMFPRTRGLRGLALTAAIALLALPGKAQVSAYSFAQNTGTYAPITGGSLIVSNSVSNPGGDDSAAIDDYLYAPVTIPFNFTYNGAVQTTFRASSNGWIAFGTGAYANGGGVISSTIAAPGAIVGFGADLRGQGRSTGDLTVGSTTITNVVNTGGAAIGALIEGTGIPAGATITAVTASTITISSAATTAGTGVQVTWTAGEIRTETIGTAPNRICVIQFKDLSLYSGINMGLNWQIRLAEAGGVAANQTVQIVYGNCFSLATTTSPQVGLRGAANTDFNNRTSTTSWTATTAGTVNSATVSFSNTILPPSGLTFTWTPPTCFSPTGVTATATGTTTGTVTFTAASPAPSGGYQYEVRTSGAPGSGATGLVTSNSVTGTTISLTGLAASTTYTVYIRGNCGTSFSNWTLGATFITQCAAFAAPFFQGFASGTLPACWTNSNPSNNTSANALWKFSGTPGYGTTANGRPDGTFAWVDASTPYVTDVTLTTPVINTATLTAPYLEFEWYKNNNQAVPAGINNNLKVEGNPNNTGWVTLFNDTSNAALWRTVGIALPAAFNNTTAQFRFISDKTLSNNFYDDLLLDSVRLINAPACLMPGQPSASAIATTSVTIAWTAPATAPASGYQYYYSTSSTAPLATQTPSGTATGTSTSITGLTPSTLYYVWVRSNCGTSQSAWVGPVSFTTLCVPVSTFPYLESFAATGLPSCWSSSNGGTSTYNWTGTASDGTYGASAPQAGPGFLYLYVFLAQTTSNPYILNTPSFTLSGPAKQIQYYYFLGNVGYKGTTGATGADPYPLQLLASTNGGTTWDTVYKHSLSNSTFATSTSTSFWTQNTVNLAAYTGQTVRFRFVSLSNYGTGIVDQGLDEVRIMNVPSCPQPNMTAATAVSSNSAQLNFTPATTAPALGYQWEVRTTGTPGSGGAISSGFAASAATSAPATGLAPVTTYTAYVRAICSPGDSSFWSSVTFTTSCAPYTLPFAENFNTFLPGCWQYASGFINTTLTNPTTNAWGADGFMNVGTTGAARINLYLGTRRDWIISPTIALGATPANYILEVNMGVTAYANTTLDTLGSDDTVAVVISYNNGATWTSANALKVWTAADDTIGAQRYYLPFTASGNIRVGFYGSEGVIDDVPDNDVFFDSVLITQCIAPTVALGNDTTLCGTGTSLTLNAGPGTGYAWSTGDTSQSIIVSNPGSYSVTVFNGGPACSRRDTINVLTGIVPTVALGPDTNVCGNVASFQLNAGNPGANYAWSSPASPLPFTTQIIDLAPIINAGNITNSGAPTNTAPVIATVTNASGCVGRDTVNVSVIFTARISDFTIGGVDPTFSFTPVLDSFTTIYAWTFGDGGTANISNPSHTYNTNGSYTVTLMVGNQCGMTDTVTKTRPVTNNVKDVTADGTTITLYPNPTAADAVLAVDGSAKLRGYQVLNAAGAVVANRTLEGVSRATLNTASFAPGIYTLRIQLDKGVVVRKLEVIK